MIRVEDLVGHFSIIGHNQDYHQNSYKGYLSLSLDENKRINALWKIGEQEQFGYGFFKGNILVVNFWYKGDDKLTYKGVVVYKCLSINLLDGFWSEKHGNPKFLGEERCFRVLEDESHVN